MFVQSQTTADELLGHISSVFGLEGIHQSRPFGRFPEDFLEKIVEIRVEAPNKRKTFSAVAYDTMVQEIMKQEPRVKVVTVPTKARVDSDYALIDWLRDSTRGWDFPSPHYFIGPESCNL